MSKELNYFPETVPYFRNYISSNLEHISDSVVEFKIYPKGGYASFPRVTEILRLLGNIEYQLDDVFNNCLIPEGFGSPNAFATALIDFYGIVKGSDESFKDAYEKTKYEITKMPLSPILQEVDEIKKKLIAVLEHILSHYEVQKYLRPDQLSMLLSISQITRAKNPTPTNDWKGKLFFPLIVLLVLSFTWWSFDSLLGLQNFLNHPNHLLIKILGQVLIGTISMLIFDKTYRAAWITGTIATIIGFLLYFKK